jgi:hypothetical protein
MRTYVQVEEAVGTLHDRRNEAGAYGWNSRSEADVALWGRMAVRTQWGRQTRKLAQNDKENETLLKNGATQVWVARRYQTTTGNLRHWMKQHGIVVQEPSRVNRS